MRRYNPSERAVAGCQHKIRPFWRFAFRRAGSDQTHHVKSRSEHRQLFEYEVLGDGDENKLI